MILSTQNPKATTNCPCGHLPPPHGHFPLRLSHVAFQVLPCAVYSACLLGCDLRFSDTNRTTSRSTEAQEQCLRVRAVSPNHRYNRRNGRVISRMEVVFRSPLVSSNVFRPASDFTPDIAHAHIKIKETFAFQAVLRLLVDDKTKVRRGSTARIAFDNTIMFHSVKDSRAKDAHIHSSVGQLYARNSRQCLPYSFVGYP